MQNRLLSASIYNINCFPQVFSVAGFLSPPNALAGSYAAATPDFRLPRKRLNRQSLLPPPISHPVRPSVLCPLCRVKVLSSFIRPFRAFCLFPQYATLFSRSSHALQAGFPDGSKARGINVCQSVGFSAQRTKVFWLIKKRPRFRAAAMLFLDRNIRFIRPLR